MVERRLVTLMITAVLVNLAGCAATSSTGVAGSWEPANAYLLFDRVVTPGSPPASAFADRPEWPSTPSHVPLFETTTYRETFIDLQGPGLTGRPDRTYRRFVTRREGASYR
jgi:hypothetical protein